MLRFANRMTIRPLSDHILIKPIEKQQKTEAGIVIPKTAEKGKPEQGKVIAVGPGKRNPEGDRIAPEVSEGDRVLFTKYGPNQIEINDKEYLIASEDDILAIIE